jgi:hypothetical protein
MTLGNDGQVTSRRCIVRVIVDGYADYLLSTRNDIRNHSPDGFEWGFGGSGPAQLALALVADCWGDEYAVPRIYQRVKFLVAKLPHDGWTLTNEEVDAVVAAAVKVTGFVPEVFSDE